MKDGGDSHPAFTGLVDVHAHEYPEAFLAACRQPDSGLDYRVEGHRVVVRQDGAIALGVPRPAPNLEDRLAAMDAAGIQTQVLSVSAPNVYRFSPRVRVPLARELNDNLIDYARRSNGRLRVFASLPLPDVCAALDEADRVLADPLVVGLMLCTTVDRRPLDDELFQPLWRALSERGTVVFVHPTTGCSTEGTREYALSLTLDYMAETTKAVARLLFSGTLERSPGIRWIFSHAGGTIPYVIHRFGEYTGQFRECREHITEDPLVTLRRLTFDTVSTHAPALRCALETFGADRFVFGTDYPHVPRGMQAFVDTLSAVGLSEADLSKVARENAMNLLGLSLSFNP
jgi:aminocarboxymuconate-semialdehyde decarboxylase